MLSSSDGECEYGASPARLAGWRPAGRPRLLGRPRHLHGLAEAVTAGGGTVVDAPEAAEAIVWWGEAATA